MSGLAGHFCYNKYQKNSILFINYLFYSIHMGYHIKQFA